MKSEAQVREELLQILSTMLEEPPQDKPGADIFEDFGLDSLDQLEFLYNVEEKFGVKIDDDTFEELELRAFDKLVGHLAANQKA